jgi:hypothetical protein
MCIKPDGRRGVRAPHRVVEVRHGKSRTVVLAGPVAVKLPSLLGWRRFLWGLLSNLAERERAGVPGACPIVWAAPLAAVLVVRRAEPLPEGAEIPGHVRALTGIDDKPCSYGIVGGEVVAVDYHGHT